MTLKPSTLAALACIVATGAVAKSPTIKDERLGACYEDMERLCVGYPDKTKLKSCIRPKRALVSAKCKAWLDAPG